MKTVHLRYTELRDNDGRHLATTSRELARFNSSLLGLGDLSRVGRRFDAVTAIFDLAGFTSFCSHPDPHLVVPEYLNDFLNWFFTAIKSSFTKPKKSTKVLLWAPMPIFAKFLGDGILLIWDISSWQHLPEKDRPFGVGNIIANLYGVTVEYRTKYFKTAQAKVNRPPHVLRCGAAMGEIVAIGNGNDFVGPSINVASRLQKTRKLSFACAKHGMNPRKCFNKRWRTMFIEKKFDIRGVGKDEIILVAKDDFQRLSTREKRLLPDP